MDSRLLEYIGIDPAYLMLGILGFSLIVFVILIVVLVKIRNLKRVYKNFMRGKDAESLEDVIVKRFREIDQLKRSDEEKQKQLEHIFENLKITYQKVGIVKYDAFKEMGGKLSFSLAMLDKENNGFVLNSMHSREGCYTYIKEIISGESFIVLGEEEKKALQMAMNDDKT